MNGTKSRPIVERSGSRSVIVPFVDTIHVAPTIQNVFRIEQFALRPTLKSGPRG